MLVLYIVLGSYALAILLSRSEVKTLKEKMEQLERDLVSRIETLEQRSHAPQKKANPKKGHRPQEQRTGDTAGEAHAVPLRMAQQQVATLREKPEPNLATTVGDSDGGTETLQPTPTGIESPLHAREARPDVPPKSPRAAPGPSIAASKTGKRPAPAFSPQREPSHLSRLWHALRERLAEESTRDQWELIVGTNWLNRIGMFVLVIGLALFLGYSFKHMTPLGRVAVGYLVSSGMLFAGVRLERLERYVIFSRGLIGGGWAGVYFTTYAMHYVEASRIIESSVFATVCLLLAAAGMIVHSLRYRSEVVTGLGYVCAFAAIAMTPAGSTPDWASIPLVASLVLVAQRFCWTRLVLAGMVASYGIIAISKQVAQFTGEWQMAPVIARQLALLGYWILFEAADIVGTLRHVDTRRIARALFPLNACGFLGASLLSCDWLKAPDATLATFLFGVAGAYLASAFLRARLIPSPALPTDLPFPDRVFTGGYEASMSVAVAAATIALFLKLQGIRLIFGLLLEGELLMLAGMRLSQTFLRQLGALVLSLCSAVLLHAFANGITSENPAPWATKNPELERGAVLLSAILYMNRGLATRLSTAPLMEIGLAGVATFLCVLLSWVEVPREYLGLALLCAALPLFGVGTRESMPDFRKHAYVVGALGLLTLFAVNLHQPQGGSIAPGTGAVLLATALLCGLMAGIARQLPAAVVSATERLLVWSATSLSASAFAMATLWYTVDPGWLCTAWWTLGWCAFEVGLRVDSTGLRLQSYFITAAAVAATVLFNVLPASAGQLWFMLVPMSLVVYGSAVRAHHLRPDGLREVEPGLLRDVSAAVGASLLGLISWHALPLLTVAIAWAILGLLLAECGYAWGIKALHRQSAVFTALAFTRLFLINFTFGDEFLLHSPRVITVVPIIALFYYLSWRISKQTDDTNPLAAHPLLQRWYLYAAFVLAIALIRFEAGRVLAVAGWSVLGVVLLAAAIRLGNRDLRWQSYAVALLEVARCWSTNFFVPEYLSGVFSGPVAGVLVALSLLICQLLSPREGPVTDGAPQNRVIAILITLDQAPRVTFSLLSTFLVASLLFHEISGNLLTVAWATQGMVLLIGGFVLRERVMRISGLALLVWCVIKLFAYDFLELDTLYRILSFIGLGLLLIGASLVYTRYREQIRQYL